VTKEKSFQNITYKSADLLDMFAPANIINQIGVLVSVYPVIRERRFYAPVPDLSGSAGASYRVVFNRLIVFLSRVFG
jgi:hypothetical protein